MLPPDDHVHSEWSWDTLTGNMERTCARAVEIGLPSVAFTEHVDFAPYVFDETHMPYMPEAFLRHMGGGMVLRHPDIDVDGYLASIERCRERFPALRILSGAEISEPHWHPEKVGKLLRGDRFQRILASVHSRPVAGGAELVDFAYGSQPPREIVTKYLQEVLRMIEGSSAFQILAHIDYPFRGWLAREETFNPTDFEDQLRTVLRALKRSGRVLEVNTRIPLHPRIVRWWFETGGDAVSFASDAHQPERVGFGFAEAAAIVEAQGFRPGKQPHDFWQRALTR
jgi:histidinol-phosphatase (PHP family)